MDLIRIFIDTAFSKVAERFLLHPGKPSLYIDQEMFVDECRKHHPELSDDQIRMIYGLYRDEWAYSIEDMEYIVKNRVEDDNNANIFNVIVRFADDVIRLSGGKPLVVFRHLFRWREVTLHIGEDLFVCAFLANHFRNNDHPYDDRKDCYIKNTLIDGIDFCNWPTILHNDNPHLRHMFEKSGLWELHSHLNASADVFAISWVNLMTRIKNRGDKFDYLAKCQDKSRKDEIARRMYALTIYGAYLRVMIWRRINNRGMDLSISPDMILDHPDQCAKNVQELISEELRGKRPLDYVPCDVTSPMRVIGGERKFIYCVLRTILRINDPQLTKLFYAYLLTKSELRRFMVQVNTNRGFANFERYQNLKSIFLTSDFRPLISRLAVWEAARFNYIRVFETRVTPPGSSADILHLSNSAASIWDPDKEGMDADWTLIFHFIKHPENFEISHKEKRELRDGKLRRKVCSQSVVLKRLIDENPYKRAKDAFLSRIRGIDAASTEIGCRPEVFAQAFRYLKGAGYAATFHVGEDFYDLADGLRAIQEAISFLGLEAGDRLGHVLALGIDAEEFYRERHNFIALPVQWMVDNVVWLYFKSREYNVILEPSTEDFLLTTFRSLVRRIGYESGTKDTGKIEIVDYYQSMQLRGDSPALHEDEVRPGNRFSTSVWRHYQRYKSSSVEEVRLNNETARELLHLYLKDTNIRRRGKMIASFQVPSGYWKLIQALQEKMMKEISKRQLGIECCPSSNIVIGYIRKYESHPIFRFMPVKCDRSPYPLTVTVNTDDLGVFATSLPNEYSLLALALMKMRDSEGNHLYSTQEVYDWVERIIANGEKLSFAPLAPDYPDLTDYEEL